MIVTLTDYFAGTCLIIGALFAVVGGIGVLRLPDLFTRMHGASITDTLGAGMILVGLSVHVVFRWEMYGLEKQLYGFLIGVKLLAVLFFLLVTSPTSTHALAASALAHGVEPELDREAND